MNRRWIHPWRLLALGTLLPLAAHAAEPGAAAPGTAPQAVSRSGTASPARDPRAGAPRLINAEERELMQIQEQGRLEVERLTRNVRDLTDGPALRAVQRQVATAKIEYRARFLRACARFARNRGDVATAERAEALADWLLHPPPPPTSTAPQPRQRPGFGEGARP